MNSRPDHFSLLPEDMLNAITDFVDPMGVLNLTMTSRHYYNFFNQNFLGKHRLVDSRKLINQFFTLVVFSLLKVPAKNNNSMLPLLENLLKQSPELLTYKLTVKDYAGRKLVNRTGYQIALAYAADNIYCMMHDHFLRLPNGEEIRKNQFQEQFPDGIIKTYFKYDIEKAREAFHKAKRFIQEDTLISYENGGQHLFLERMSDNTKVAINEFFTMITSNNEYTIGLINDMQFYDESIQIYHDAHEFYKFKGWPQRVAYCVFILGGLQALLTPNILQIILQGENAKYVTDERKVLWGTTKDYFHPRLCGFDVSPFVLDSQFCLGKHFFIDRDGFCISGQEVESPINLPRAWPVLRSSETFYSEKLIKLESLIQTCHSVEESSKTVKPRCMIQ